MSALDHPLRSALWLLGSFIVPVIAAAQTSEAPPTSFRFFATPPPWAVEAPGAAGVRFGLGLDVFAERQESLRIAGLERFLRERDLGSGLEEGGVFHEDPELLNRKFDLLLELEGVGGEVALALPGVGAPGAFQIHPTLIFQAAAADVRLDFLDRTQAGDSTSYEGRGPVLTTGFDLTTSLCRSCPWFAGASYRFQKLPSLSVDRSPAFTLPGFTVEGDEVHLARDVHEVSTRVGTSRSRIASYLGARYRWTDLEVEDELRYRDSLGVTETRLSSRADLESEATLAIAGVEAHLAGSFYGRMEAGFSEVDRVVLAQVVYLPSRKSDTEPPREETSSIAAKIRAIRADFVKGFDALPEVVETAAFRELLNQIKDRLLAVLPLPEYAAMHAWVSDRFDRTRALLDSRIVALVSVRFLAQDARPEEDLIGARNLLLAMFDRLIERFENHDILVDLCVRSEPVPGARVDLYPAAFPEDEHRRKVTSHGEQRLRRGLWVAEISRTGYQSGVKDYLDLMDEDSPIVECRLSRSQSSYCSVAPRPVVPGWSCRDAGR